MNLNLGIVAKHFAPYDLGLTLDWVRNTGFDNNDIVRRAGTNAVADLAEMTTAWQAQVLFGNRDLAAAGAWQAFFTYRHFERDAGDFSADRYRTCCCEISRAESG